MTYYDGKKSYVGIAKQDVAGTANTAADIFIATESWPSLKMNTPNYYAKEFRGAMGEIQNVYRKSDMRSTGGISSHLYTDWASYAFYGVLGTVGSAGDDEGYTHTITAAATTLPIWTVFTGLDTVDVIKYRDLTMKSIKLGFSPGERLTMDVDFEGGPIDNATSVLTPTYTTLRPLDYADVSISLGGSPNCDIESMDLTISRSPAFNKTMCTGNLAWSPNMVYPTTVMAEGSFTMYFSGYTEYEYWLGATGVDTVLTDTYDRTTADRALTITITSTGTEIKSGGTATKDSVTITLPEIIYDDATITPTYDDRVKVVFNWKAVHNATAETAVAGTGTVKVDIVSEIADPDA